MHYNCTTLVTSEANVGDIERKNKSGNITRPVQSIESTSR